MNGVPTDTLSASGDMRWLHEDFAHRAVILENVAVGLAPETSMRQVLVNEHLVEEFYRGFFLLDKGDVGEGAAVLADITRLMILPGFARRGNVRMCVGSYASYNILDSIRFLLRLQSGLDGRFATMTPAQSERLWAFRDRVPVMWKNC